MNCIDTLRKQIISNPEQALKTLDNFENRIKALRVNYDNIYSVSPAVLQVIDIILEMESDNEQTNT